MSGEPSPASLPLLAHHAKAAGDAAVCVRFSVEASRNALAANAPEEVLRVVELALPSPRRPQERVELLEARDRALDMLRRPDDRMQGLAELAALAEALGDSRLGLDVRLRRAAAMRTPRNTTAPPSSRARCGSSRPSGATARASSPRAWSSART